MISVVVYQYNAPYSFLDLSQYGVGSKVTVRRRGQEIKVNEDEKRHLLKLHNGNPRKGAKPLFVEKEVG